MSVYLVGIEQTLLEGPRGLEKYSVRSTNMEEAKCAKPLVPNYFHLAPQPFEDSSQTF